MLFITIGDIIGVILLLAVGCYVVYMLAWNKVDDYKKRKPYHTKSESVPKKVEKTKPKEKFTLADFWRAFWPFIIFAIIFGVLIILLIVTSK